MRSGKKLQVFVSSTYNDLREERQAAVEAILTAGHIPAGMELFTAGDQSQMDVIRRWIDESDVFLLILGGRYGSLEPTTGKSYTQLEYEYATERGKPLFAVVLDDTALDKRIKKAGRGAVEIENAAKLGQFRETVLCKMVRFWSDVRDIKLAVYETMGEFSRRSELIGWIPGDEGVNAGLLAEELARLTKENAELQAKVAQSARPIPTYNGLTYSELADLLASEHLPLVEYSESNETWAKEVVDQYVDTATVLDLLWTLQAHILPGGIVYYSDPRIPLLLRLATFGVLQITTEETRGLHRFELTPDGRNFTVRLLADSRQIINEKA
jgi:hypothetical protein